MNYVMNFKFKDQKIQNEIETVLAGIKVPFNDTFIVKSQDTQNAESFFRFHSNDVCRIPSETQAVWCQKNPNRPRAYSFYYIGQYDTYRSRTLGSSFVRQLYGWFVGSETESATRTNTGHYTDAYCNIHDLNYGAPVTNMLERSIDSTFSVFADAVRECHTRDIWNQIYGAMNSAWRV